MTADWKQGWVARACSECGHELLVPVAPAALLDAAIRERDEARAERDDLRFMRDVATQYLDEALVKLKAAEAERDRLREAIYGALFDLRGQGWGGPIARNAHDMALDAVGLAVRAALEDGR